MFLYHKILNFHKIKNFQRIKAFYCVDHNLLQRILKEMGIPDHLTRFLRNLYEGQEANRTGHGTVDWFQIWKGVRQSCILPLSLFNFYTESITQNAGLDESQARNELAGRNINNVRYADDTTIMAKSEEELNSLLMKVKEEHEKTGINGNSDRFLFSWASKSLQIVTAVMK